MIYIYILIYDIYIYIYQFLGYQSTCLFIYYLSLPLSLSLPICLELLIAWWFQGRQTYMVAGLLTVNEYSKNNCSKREEMELVNLLRYGPEN
jgi:hypothetical protein